MQKSKIFMIVMSLIFISILLQHTSASNIGAWNPTTSMPQGLESPVAVAFGDYIYVLGGLAFSNNLPSDNAYRAFINADGSLSSWESTSSFGNSRYLHAAVVDPQTRTVYVIGGVNNTSGLNPINSVQYTKILDNGHLSAPWINGTPLPNAGRYGHSAIVYNGYLYVIGGAEGGVERNDYYFAKINSDGSLGSWQQGFYAFSTPRRYLAAVSYNSYVYVIGGLGWEIINKVEFARLAPQDSIFRNILKQGELEPPKQTLPFSTKRFLHSAVAYNDFIYLIGGASDFGGVGDLNNVQYARIKNDGALESWKQATSLPQSRTRHTSVAHKGHIYVLGGIVESTLPNTVIYSKIESSDTIPPQTRSSLPAGEYQFPIKLNLSAKDIGDSGVDETYYTLDGSEPTISSQKASLTANIIDILSSLIFKAKTIDRSGNEEPTVTYQYKISATQYPPPVNGFIFPTDSKYKIASLINNTVELIQYDQSFANGTLPGEDRSKVYRVEQDFGQFNPNNSKRHLGEDWNRGGGSDDAGDVVHSIADGEVINISSPTANNPTNNGWGRVIIIKHIVPNSYTDVPLAGDGTKFVVSLYGHLGSDQAKLNSTPHYKELKIGDKVTQGQPIGYIGSQNENGNVVPHLHFELRTPNHPAVYVRGTGYFENLGNPIGFVDPSAFIKKYYGSNQLIIRLDIGGLTDIAGTTPAISVGGDRIGFRNSPIYHLYDSSTGLLSSENSDADGTLGNGGYYTTAFSSDGRYKAFVSDNANLVSEDTNGASDVFVWDRETGNTERISRNNSGVQANGASFDVSISSDGRYVAFTSLATNLINNDNNDASDVFIYDTQTQTIELATKDSSGNQANKKSYSPSISSDGSYLAFVSDATNLVSGDTNTFADVFVKDMQSGVVSIISRNNSGVQANGASRQPSITGEGRYIVYESQASNLVSNDFNGFSDIFLYDREKSENLLLTANSNGNSHEPRISSYGLKIAFVSEATNLVSGDTNTKPDVFAFSFMSNPAQCSDECSLGANQCSGSNIQTCGNYDADSCTEWGNSQACANGCENNQCKATGENDCSVTKWNIIFKGTHGQLGANGDTRFYCFTKRFYECAWEMTDSSLAYEMKHAETIDKWQCDLNNKKWVANGTIVLPPAPDCKVFKWGQWFTGYNNKLGLNGGVDGRFLCSGNRIYECGWSLKDESFAVDAKNGVIVGSWACSLNALSWKIAGKTLDSAEVNYFANSAYKYILNRSIDQAGLNYWVGQLNKGMPRRDMLLSLYKSSEYQNVNGISSLNNDGFVRFLYNDLLLRPADSSGLTYWVGQLNKGASRASVAKALINSAEFDSAFSSTL